MHLELLRLFGDVEGRNLSVILAFAIGLFALFLHVSATDTSLVQHIAEVPAKTAARDREACANDAGQLHYHKRSCRYFRRLHVLPPNSTEHCVSLSGWMWTTTAFLPYTGCASKNFKGGASSESCRR